MTKMHIFKQTKKKKHKTL